MRQEIRYLRTADGYRIAHAVIGEGPPLVYVPAGPFTHLQRDFAVDDHRAFYEHLAQRRTLIRYDGRGFGLSDRSYTRFAFNDLVDDLATVVDEAGAERVDLIGFFQAGAISLAYAARHPERVGRIAILGTVFDLQEYMNKRQMRGLLALAEHDWELFTETTAHAWLGWDEGEPARHFASVIRASATPQSLTAYFRDLATTDIRPLLSGVTAPVMVMHPVNAVQYELAWASDLAAALPNGRLVLLEGVSHSPLLGDGGAAVLRAMDAFFDEDVAPPARVVQLRPVARTNGDGADALTPRERDVLRLLAAGDSNKEIARALGVTVNTVERHVANLYRKIGARGRADATAYALQRNLG